MKAHDIASLLLIAVLLVGGLASLAILPETIAVHWNAAGEADGYGSSTGFFAVFAAITICFFLLLKFLPRIDPLKKNYLAFQREYDIFVAVFVAFMVFLYYMSIASNIGFGFNIATIVLVGIAAICYVIGVLLAKSKRNWFVGIRTPWTLSSDAVWNETHRIAAKLFKAMAVLVILILVFGEITGFQVFFIAVGLILVFAIAPAAYSYVLYSRETKK